MRFHVVANAARECVAGFADRLYGCSHKLKAFPDHARGRNVCRVPRLRTHFAYDRATMRITTVLGSKGPWWLRRGITNGLFLPWAKRFGNAS